jgi:hypothetical protein
MHLSLTRISGLRTEQKVVKPLTTQFVKRQPRLTKPLELKKRPQPKRRVVQRTMVAVKAQMQREEGGTPFEPAQVLGGLAGPGAAITRSTVPSSAEFEPTSVAEAIQGAREAEQKIDMSLELLDISALNTGQYHAMVIQDPEDRRSVKGFCRLSWLYIPRLHDRAIEHVGGRGNAWANHYVGDCIRNLADAMNRYTAIKTHVGQRVIIDNPETFQVPWVFHLSFYYAYDLSDGELETLGRYLVGGGFLFADSHPLREMSVAPSHRRNLLAALKTQGICADFQILPSSHPVYHCYFDFSAPPPAADATLRMEGFGTLQYEWRTYLEGLEAGNRLVSILSEKGYYSPWCDWGAAWDHTRQDQFGVNLIVFALTQEGSITHRLMDSVR